MILKMGCVLAYTEQHLLAMVMNIEKDQLLIIQRYLRQTTQILKSSNTQLRQRP